MDPPPLYDGFLAAEIAVDHVIDHLLNEGSKVLYHKYIEKKSYPFAAKAITDLLVSNLEMCFVARDPGEVDMAQWEQEPEPISNTIDTWARSCVPIRKKVKAEVKMQTEKRPARKTQRPEGKTDPVEAKAPPRGPTKLIEEYEMDEEEELMRDMKEREAKRKRDEETRIRKQELDVADEAARLAKVQNEMKNKPFTYDSDGNIIWIQPVNAEKLPNQTPAMNFKTHARKRVEEEIPKATPKKGLKPTKSAKKEAEFTDSFKRLTSQQPSAVEAMAVAPGVSLFEKGRMKKGTELDKQIRHTMSRKEYAQKVATGDSGGINRGTPEAQDAERIPLPQDLPPGIVTPAPPSEAPESSYVPRAVSVAQDVHDGTSDAFNMSILASDDWGKNPPSDGPPGAQPMPPHAVHDYRLKRDAVGHLGKVPRERIPPLGSYAGFRMPQPPLGATMGHGLLPEKEESFYFPGQTTLPTVVEGGSPTSSRPDVADHQEGTIRAENKALMNRIFGTR